MKKLLVLLLATTLSVSTANAGITGAGASFPAPLYNKWAADYNKKTGSQLNYQAIGSGGGIAQIDAKTVDFGATDDPRKADDLASHKQVQFETVKGGVVAIVNLNGVAVNQINLSAKQLVDIFEGKYKKWNEVDSKLPATPIVRVVRSDASGTTAIFTNYLAKNGSSIKPSKSLELDGDVVSGKGNAGVAGMVQQIRGSIGYVEYAYAKQSKLITTKLNGVEPNFNTFSSGKYELTAATYIIFYKEGAKKEAVDFWLWALSNGDQSAKDLDYVPLNDKEKAESVKILKSLK